MKLIKEVQSKKFEPSKLRNPQFLKGLLTGQTSIGKKLEHFLATGNLTSKSQLDLQQTAGFCMVADKLNNTRYLSHFRSIHRGQYFTEMKTTTVRKLLPEAWGFICPVHTPDGSPCGLLNHITLSCSPLSSEEVNMKENMNPFRTLCAKLGMHPLQTDFNLIQPHTFLPVMLDGIVLGYLEPDVAPIFANALRAIKVKPDAEDELHKTVPMSLEIAYLAPGRHSKDSEVDPKAAKNYYFPGVFLSSTVSRFVRPV